MELAIAGRGAGVSAKETGERERSTDRNVSREVVEASL